MGAQTNKYQKTKSRIYILCFVKVKQQTNPMYLHHRRNNLTIFLEDEQMITSISLGMESSFYLAFRMLFSQKL